MRLLVELPDSLVARLDAAAERELNKTRPVPMLKWLNDTPEGRFWWSQNCHRVDLNSGDMNALVRSAWAKATGGTRSGRPNIAVHRAKIIEEALAAHLQPKLLEAAG